MIRAARPALALSTLALALALTLALTLATLGNGCGSGCGDTAMAPAVVAPIAANAPHPPDPEDVARGRVLVGEFQCNRCHRIDGVDPPARTADCVVCHQAIAAGTFPASPEDLATWASHITDLVDTPSLFAIGARFDPGFVERFLLSPHDLRPGLTATMPRLSLDEAQAHAITAFLTRDIESSTSVGAHANGREPSDAPSEVARGRALFASRGCTVCHRFADHLAPERGAPTGAIDEASRLAPDLAVARERFRRDRLTEWIRDPTAIKPDTRMPSLHLPDEEARALASYVLFAELDAPARVEAPPLLPILDRRVTYEEVDERVFRRTCRHCHADPDLALGDGGLGNDGGFGFARRGLNLTNYEGAASGVLVDGQRVSIFAPDASGLPRLVHALRARQLEEAGQTDPEIRGMPLAHPALSAQDIQLVATWIAAGRPRE